MPIFNKNRPFLHNSAYIVVSTQYQYSAVLEIELKPILIIKKLVSQWFYVTFHSQRAFGQIIRLVLLELTRHLVCACVRRAAEKGCDRKPGQLHSLHNTVPPTRTNLHKSAVVLATGEPPSSFELGQGTPVVSGKCAHGGSCTHVISRGPCLKAVVLACCHILALHRGGKAAPAWFSWCVSSAYASSSPHVPGSHHAWTVQPQSWGIHVISRIKTTHACTRTNPPVPCVTSVWRPHAAVTDFRRPTTSREGSFQDRRRG